MLKIGFIDYYLDEWHANNYPRWISEESGGEAKVTLAWALMDSPKANGRTTQTWCKDMGIPMAGSIRQVLEECDSVIVLSPDDCQLHEMLCDLPLKSGKPVFVDKTFSPDAASARRMFAKAAEYHTPCYSSSALRYATEYQNQGHLDTICSWGPGSFDNYSVHQIEPVLMMMKGAPRRVMALKYAERVAIAVEFEDGRLATMDTLSGGPFLMHLSGEQGKRVVEAKSDYFRIFLREYIDFAKTGITPVAPEETIAVMAVREAGLHALSVPGTWIPVELR